MRSLFIIIHDDAAVMFSNKLDLEDYGNFWGAALQHCHYLSSLVHWQNVHRMVNTTNCTTTVSSACVLESQGIGKYIINMPISNIVNDFLKTSFSISKKRV